MTLADVAYVAKEYVIDVVTSNRRRSLMRGWDKKDRRLQSVSQRRLL